MKRFLAIMTFAAVLVLSLTACFDEGQYDVGSGTASRAEVSYPAPSEEGMKYESSFTLPGDGWHVVSN